MLLQPCLNLSLRHVDVSCQAALFIPTQRLSAQKWVQTPLKYHNKAPFVAAKPSTRDYPPMQDEAQKIYTNQWKAQPRSPTFNQRQAKATHDTGLQQSCGSCLKVIQYFSSLWDPDYSNLAVLSKANIVLSSSDKRVTLAPATL